MAQLLTRDELLSREEYEKIRDRFRREIMVQKRTRRILVGSNCSVHFENRDIMKYQILEMLRCEGTWENEEAIEDELHSYNPLITQPGVLSATCMFEYPTEEERQRELTRLVGIHEHIFLQIGEGRKIPGEFDPSQITSRKISSVQFVKFTLTEDEERLLERSGTVVRFLIDHPDYTAQAILGEETRNSISVDLQA